MKIFAFAAVAVAFLQVVSGNRDSAECRDFVPEHACDHCDFSRSYVQYVKNPCNCTEYYSCEKTRGYITAHKQHCVRCLCFSDVTWGCTDRNEDAENCPTETPITEQIWTTRQRHCFRYGNGPSGLYLQEFAEVEGDGYDENYLWFVNDYPVKMPCPAGTYFNLTECQCVHCNGHIPCAGWKPVDLCLDWNDWFGSKKLWYEAGTQCTVTPPTPTPSPHWLELNGHSCDVEVPWFQKNEFSQFTLCLTFFFTGSGPAGLAFDGGRPSDDCHPSISLEIDANNNLVGGIYTGSPPGPVTVTGPVVTPNEWHSACLRYNGNSLELIYGPNRFNPSSSSWSVPATGTTELNRCNMVLGASIDQTVGEYHYFRGNFGKFCFSRSVLDPVAYDMLGP